VAQGDLHRCLAVERRHPGQTLVGDRAERVDVRRGRHRLARHLLRRHVQHGAGYRVRGRDGGDRGRTGHPEVDQYDGAVLLHQQVAGLDVAVDHPAGVGRVQRVGGLGHDRQGVDDRQPAGGRDAVRQRFTVDVGHHQVGGRAAVEAALAEVVHVDDVRVPERGQNAGLGPEPRREPRIGQQRGQQHLDGDAAAQHDVGGAPDLTHAAAGEEGVETVSVAEKFSGAKHMGALPHWRGRYAPHRATSVRSPVRATPARGR
jgi:hypothetical protein